MTELQHVIRVEPSAFTIGDGRVEVHQLCAWTDNFIWVMYDSKQRAAVIVDGPCAAPFADWLKSHPCEKVSIWNTHHHGDHIGINKELRDGILELPVDVYGYSGRKDDIPGLSHTLNDGDEIGFGGETFKVWQTDGHVDGHLCFVHDEVLFCGDTLFAGGCGYLFDGPPAAMHDSLTRLNQLADNVKVCCAHEYTLDNLTFAAFLEPENPQVQARLSEAENLKSRGETTLPSTMYLERQTNPFLRTAHERLRLAVLALVDDEVQAGLELFTLVRKLKDQKIHRH
jgi:hydroxyacylglutathione hydrolase